MKILKFVVSFLLFLGVLFLLVWAGIKSNDQRCNQISILINSSNEFKLLTESDILHVLKQNNMECEGKTIKEVELASIHKILAKENYIKTVDKVHFLSSKLQIEVTLYNILLEIQLKNGEKFLLDENGTYLPYSPKVGSGVIIAQGTFQSNYKKKETISMNDYELSELLSLASHIHADPFYSELFCKLDINEKQEITLYPSVGQLPVLFGTTLDATKKLKSLRYMYKEVLPYMNEDKYARLDVRFKNRIIATKSKA